MHKIHTIGALVLQKRSGTRIVMIELLMLMLLRFTGGSGRHRDSLFVLTTTIDSAADSWSGWRRFLEVLIECIVDDSLLIQRSSSSTNYHFRSRRSYTSTYSISVQFTKFLYQFLEVLIECIVDDLLSIQWSFSSTNYHFQSQWSYTSTYSISVQFTKFLYQSLLVQKPNTPLAHYKQFTSEFKQPIIRNKNNKLKPPKLNKPR